MDVFADLIYGFSVALSPVNLLYLAIGVLVGMVVGVMPGLGASAGIAILLPLTFSMDPTSAIVMLAAIYYGAMFGGTITSVLINTPGSPRPSQAPSMDTRWPSKGVRGRLWCSVRWGPSWLARSGSSYSPCWRRLLPGWPSPSVPPRPSWS